ncbi:hypothetical protein E2C01_101406 [Portunus trituberculatus]|uniref:Uncharacterized protein n=1 Tax=Portunus trituberculatus TaxID=210409 RepID=A0A5B7K9I8_PORTR|nr:hypothetical protein [Portunus trituberculatus]
MASSSPAPLPHTCILPSVPQTSRCQSGEEGFTPTPASPETELNVFSLTHPNDNSQRMFRTPTNIINLECPTPPLVR